MGLYEYFETRSRDDGETFTTTTEDVPEWLQDAVMSAHDGEFPDDWRYDMCKRIAGAIDDGDISSQDSIGEFADGATDVYNMARLQWLAGNLNRASYVDEARSEGLVGLSADLFEMIGVGQYICIERMAYVIWEAYTDHRDDIDVEEETDDYDPERDDFQNATDTPADYEGDKHNPLGIRNEDNPPANPYPFGEGWPTNID